MMFRQTAGKLSLMQWRWKSSLTVQHVESMDTYVFTTDSGLSVKEV